MLRLRRLKINRYRNVKPGTELRFHDGIHVLVGKNGTGKTTLLDLISAVLRSEFSTVCAEPIDIEYELEMRRSEESWTISGHMRTQELPGHTPLILPERQLRTLGDTYIRLGGETYHYQQEGERVRLKRGEILMREVTTANPSLGSGFVILLTDVDDSDVSVVAQLALNITADTFAAIRFDESLGYFNFITNSNTTLLFYSPAVGAEESLTPKQELIERIISRSAPAPLYRGIKQRLEQDQDASTLKFTHEELPFLRTAVPLLGCKSATLELSLLKREIEDDGSEVRQFGDYRFLFTRKGGRSTVRHDALSYGQKRLLALLYYLDSNPNHLIADELVNGLHHEWLELIMDELGDRQAFLSSQNPLLFDYLTFSSPEDVSRSFIMCELDDDQRMVWRNMAEDDAASFYTAYEVGIQHVGEILRTKGLW